jgi:hypothetical protein
MGEAWKNYFRWARTVSRFHAAGGAKRARNMRDLRASAGAAAGVCFGEVFR